MRCTVQHFVVDGMGTDDLGLAAGFGRAQAQQPDQIRSIAVEVLTQIGAVLTHPGLGADLFVTDVGKQVGVPVLPYRAAQ